MSGATSDQTPAYQVSTVTNHPCCYQVDINYTGTFVGGSSTSTLDFFLSSETGIDFKTSCGNINFQNMGAEVIATPGQTVPFNTTKTGFVCGGSLNHFIVHVTENISDCHVSGTITVTITAVASGSCT